MPKMVPFSVMSENSTDRGEEVYKAIYVRQDAGLAVQLLRSGAQPNWANWSGWTSLHLCAWMGNDEKWATVATELIAHGADIDAVDDRCSTALHWACNEGRARFALQLIDAGANIHIASEHGWTPLHEAAYKGLADVVRRLLASGADVHGISRRNLSASTIAKEFGHTELAEELAALEGARAPLRPVSQEAVASAAADVAKRAAAASDGACGGASGGGDARASAVSERSRAAEEERKWRFVLIALLVATAIALVRI